MNRRQIENSTLYILELHLGEVMTIEGTVRGSGPDEVVWTGRLVVSMRLAATKSLIAHPRKFNSSALTIHILPVDFCPHEYRLHEFDDRELGLGT